MKRNRKANFLSILLLFTLLLTSCGGTGAESDTIATAVAMTVSAQDTEKAQATATPKPTEADPTSMPETTPTLQAAPTFSPPTAPGPVGTGNNCQVLANLVSETVPDGTIMQPNETFWKSWRLKNNGTCTWNSAYKIVYWSGDLMGGLQEYQFPDVVNPGEEVDVKLFLKAPASNGNFSSYWKLQSEWGTPFGVGQYDQPFYVQINVNDSSNPNYTVTNVTYNIVRDPVAGCATNVWYYVNATISTNGPATVRYRWLQSDGNNMSENGKALKFTEAGSQTLTRSWSFHLGATAGTKWMQIVILEPEYQEFPQATFVYDCQ
jgi:Ig-like domain from next to BRCA1 gene